MEPLLLSLPFDFDTAASWRQIARLVFGLIGAMLLMLLIALLMGKLVAAAQLGLVLAVLMVLLTRLRPLADFGATGTLTATEVVTRPVTAYGIRLRAPVGRFPVSAFTSIRVEVRLANATPGRPMHDLGVVSLVGDGATPDVCVYDGDADGAKRFASELGTLLDLQTAVTSAPGRTRLDIIVRR